MLKPKGMFMFRALLSLLQSLSCASPECSKHVRMKNGVHWQPESHPGPNLCIRYHLKPCAPRHAHSCKVQVEFWLRAIEPHCKAPCMHRREASGNGASILSGHCEQLYPWGSLHQASVYVNRPQHMNETTEGYRLSCALLTVIIVVHDHCSCVCCAQCLRLL